MGPRSSRPRGGKGCAVAHAGDRGRAGACSSARPRRPRAPAPGAGLCRAAERRTDLRAERGSGGGTDPWGLSVRWRARSARLGPRRPLPQPGRSAGPPGAGLGGGRGRRLRGGGQVTRDAGGPRGRGFPQLAKGTALVPRAPSVCQSPSLALGLAQYCGIVHLLGTLVSMERDAWPEAS